MDMLRAVAIAGLVFGAAGVSAEEWPATVGFVTYRVHARITEIKDPTGVLGGASVGDSVSGAYSINTMVSDQDPDPMLGSYYQLQTEGAAINLTLNGIVLKNSPLSQEPLLLDISNMNLADQYRYYSAHNEPLRNGGIVDRISFEMNDFDGTALTTDELTGETPFANGFDDKFIKVDGRSADNSWYYFQAEIDTLEIVLPFSVSPLSAL